MLRREERAGAPKARGDLVADEQNVVLGARLGERTGGARLSHAHAGGALHERLDDRPGESVMVALDERGRGVSPAGIVVSGRAHHVEAQRVEQVGTESIGAERE